MGLNDYEYPLVIGVQMYIKVLSPANISRTKFAFYAILNIGQLFRAIATKSAERDSPSPPSPARSFPFAREYSLSSHTTPT